MLSKSLIQFSVDGGGELWSLSAIYLAYNELNKKTAVMIAVHRCGRVKIPLVSLPQLPVPCDLWKEGIFFTPSTD